MHVRLLILLPLVVAAACAGQPSAPFAPPAASPTPVAVPPTDAPGEPILVLAGGTLVDGNGGPPMPDAVVMIRGNRILAVGRRADAAIPAAARVIDVTGATILPGFINAHVHAGYNAANLKAWAQAGVTTVRDLGVAPWDDAFVRRDALLRDPANARLVAAGPLVTVSGGYPMVPWGMAGPGRGLAPGRDLADQPAAGQRRGHHQDRASIRAVPSAGRFPSSPRKRRPPSCKPPTPAAPVSRRTCCGRLTWRAPWTPA